MISASKNQWVIATGNGALELLQIQPAGKRPMPVGDFLRGYPFSPGDHVDPVDEE